MPLRSYTFRLLSGILVLNLIALCRLKNYFLNPRLLKTFTFDSLARFGFTFNAISPVTRSVLGFHLLAFCKCSCCPLERAQKMAPHHVLKTIFSRSASKNLIACQLKKHTELKILKTNFTYQNGLCRLCLQ